MHKMMNYLDGGIDMTNKHFCILPWIHMHIWPNGSTYPCCLAKTDYVVGNTNNNSISELFNSEKMKTLRANMLADKPTSACAKCYEHEQLGIESHRLCMNRDFAHLEHVTAQTHLDGQIDNIQMAYMDIRFSNICNFKCRTCCPELSSAWVDDAITLGQYNKNQPKYIKFKPTIDTVWDDISEWIDTVEYIYFAGGEPLIMDEHYQILQYLIDNNKTHIRIAYNTNFSKLNFKGTNVLEMWQKFDNVHLGASLDAMGPRAELMRKGTKWNIIEQNRIALMDQAPHVNFQISCTVSAFNAIHMFDFFDDWLNKQWVTPDRIDLNLLLDPSHMRASILPRQDKNNIITKIDKYVNMYDLQNIDHHGRAYASMSALKNMMLDTSTDNTNATQFFKYNNLLNNIRNEDLLSIFPELRYAYENTNS